MGSAAIGVRVASFIFLEALSDLDVSAHEGGPVHLSDGLSGLQLVIELDETVGLVWDDVSRVRRVVLGLEELKQLFIVGSWWQVSNIDLIKNVRKRVD